MTHQVALQMGKLRSSQVSLVACAALLGVMTVVGYCQQPTSTVSVTHPGGLTRIELESPTLLVTGDEFIYYPAGRFQLWTGPAGPVGGNPTYGGDENLNIASVAVGSTYGPTFTSKVTVAVDPSMEGGEQTGYFYDINQLMDEQDSQDYQADLTNYWTQAPVAGSRDVVGTYRLPVAFDDDDDDIVTDWVEVREALTLIGDALRVEHIVYNTTSTEHRIGLRIVFDGLFGGGTAQDGQPIVLPDGTALTSETELPETTGQKRLLPDTWVTYDDLQSPSVAIRGVVSNDDVLDQGTASKSAGLPSSIAWGQMRNLGQTGQYYYTPNSGAALIGEDWGYAVKWEPVAISPGQSCRFVTYYGVGTSTPDYDGRYAFMVYSPYALTPAPGDDPATPTVEQYHLTDSQGRSPFPISAYVDNFGSETMLDASARIRLPVGLELAAGETLTKSIGVVRRNELKSATWYIQAASARPGQYTVKFTGPQGKVLERTITIPAVPVLTPLESLRGLEMVSIPYQFLNSDAEWVLQDLGSLQPGGNATVVRYDPYTEQYKFFPDPAITNIEPGMGFWLLNLTRATVVLPADATPVSQEEAYSIRLSRGWNQIGSPFTVSMPLSDVSVVAADGSEWSMNEAYSRRLLLPTAFAYDAAANDYTWEADVAESVLDPYQGYWLRAYEPITLQFPPPTLLAPASADGGGPVLGGGNSDGWSVSLMVSAAGRHKAGRRFGVRGEAESGLDITDVPQPPVAAANVSGVASAGFVVGDGPVHLADRLLVDNRPPASSTQWRFAVTTCGAEEEVTVTWDDLGTQLPGTLIATLVDSAAGERIYMRTNTSYTYRTRVANETRLLEVVVQERGANALSVTSVAAQQGPGGQVGITYSLSAAANVDIVMRNISGVPVAEVATNRTSAEGINTVMWNGVNRGGARVPAGSYICHIRARSPETGQETNAVRTFRISR